MSAQNDLDRTLGEWFHGDATSAPPAESLARVLESTRTLRPRTARLAWIGSSWVDSDDPDGLRVLIGGLRPALVMALTLLLVLALVGGALLVGSRVIRPKAPPFGLAGNGLIAVEKEGDILVTDRPGGDLRPLVAGPERDMAPMFSPDGTTLSFVRETEQGPAQMLADADGTNVIQIPPTPGEMTYRSFAPDGRSLLATGPIRGPWRVVVRPIDPAVAPTVLDIQLDGSSMVRYQTGGPSFNPTNAQEVLVVGKRAADAPRGIYVFSLATSEVRTILEETGDQYVFDVAWLPDGEHITYRSTTTDGVARVLAADGSADQPFDALLGRVSPISNDGTRIVAERDGEDEQTPRPVIIRIDGEGSPVRIACGSETDLECPQLPSSWVWSPDDSILIGIIFDDARSSDENPLPQAYVRVDPATGEVAKLAWRDLGTPAWQRVAP